MPFEPRKTWYVSFELPKPKLKAAVRRSPHRARRFSLRTKQGHLLTRNTIRVYSLVQASLIPICLAERYRREPFIFGFRKASAIPPSIQDAEGMQTVNRSLEAGVVAAALTLSVSLFAVEPPSKPFLDKNSFYLSSAGFKVHFAKNAVGRKAMHALPPHRFVSHNLGGGDVWYLYAEPQHCACIFIGTKDAYQIYRSILSQPLSQAADVSADYKTQASALLMDDPVNMFGQPPYAAAYFRDYY